MTMDDAPPYSPTATASERRLPNDYQHVREEEDPLESLSRAKTSTSGVHDQRLSGEASARGSFSAPSCSASHAPRPIVIAPVIPSPLSAGAPSPAFLYSPELPPDYAPVDELARSFRLEAPFIFTTKTSSVPRYQLMQEFTRSGRPRRLHIRRLMASETRSASLPNIELVATDGRPRIRYDEDGTMYSMTSYDMRGHRSSTLGGLIKLETGKAMGGLGGKWTKITHVTKNKRRDSLNPENESRINKWGYHAEEEWDKRVLFYVKRGMWEDGNGRKVAVEEAEEGIQLEILEGASEGKAWKRDLLIASWVLRIWMAEGIRWEGDVKGW